MQIASSLDQLPIHRQYNNQLKIQFIIVEDARRNDAAIVGTHYIVYTIHSIPT